MAPRLTTMRGDRWREAVDAIILAAASEYGVSGTDLRGPAKRSELVRCRRSVCVQLREFGCTVEEIGVAINRCHTSVLHLLATAPVARVQAQVFSTHSRHLADALAHQYAPV